MCGEHAAYERADYDPDGKAERLQTMLFGDEKSHLHVKVVEIDGRLVGYASYTFDYSTWDANWFCYLDCLYMREATRGLGIGEELMNGVREHARARGCDVVQWQTPMFNTRAMKFYERIGAFGKDKKRFFWSC